MLEGSKECWFDFFNWLFYYFVSPGEDMDIKNTYNQAD